MMQESVAMTHIRTEEKITFRNFYPNYSRRSDETSVELFPCPICQRKFRFPLLIKHQATCGKVSPERALRSLENKNGDISQPFNKINSMASMLQLGKTRRRLWRSRHEEFQNAMKAQKPPTLCAGDETSQLQLSASTDRNRLKEVPSTRHQSQSNKNNKLSSEQLAAIQRFKCRMKYRPILGKVTKITRTPTPTSSESIWSASQPILSMDYPSPTSSISLGQSHTSPQDSPLTCHPMAYPPHVLTTSNDSLSDIDLETVTFVTGHQSLEYSMWKVADQSSNCNQLPHMRPASKMSTGLQERITTLLTNITTEKPSNQDEVKNLNYKSRVPYPQPIPLDAINSPIECSSPSSASSISTVSLIPNKLIEASQHRKKNETALWSQFHEGHPMHCPWSPTVSSFARTPHESTTYGTGPPPLHISSVWFDSHTAVTGDVGTHRQKEVTTHALETGASLITDPTSTFNIISSPLSVVSVQKSSHPTRSSGLLQDKSPTNNKVTRLKTHLVQCSPSPSNKLQDSIPKSGHKQCHHHHHCQKHSRHKNPNSQLISPLRTQHPQCVCRRTCTVARREDVDASAPSVQQPKTPSACSNRRRLGSSSPVKTLGGDEGKKKRFNYSKGNKNTVHVVSQTKGVRVKSRSCMTDSTMTIVEHDQTVSLDPGRASESANTTLLRRDSTETHKSLLKIGLSGDFNSSHASDHTTVIVHPPSTPSINHIRVTSGVKPNTLGTDNCSRQSDGISIHVTQTPSPVMETYKRQSLTNCSGITTNPFLQTYLPGMPTTFALTKAMLHQNHEQTPSEKFHQPNSPHTGLDRAGSSELDYDCPPSVHTHATRSTPLTFCHECGTRYAAKTAKFCSTCGTGRPHVTPCSNPIKPEPTSLRGSAAGFLTSVWARLGQ